MTEVPQATARTSVGGPSMKGWNEAMDQAVEVMAMRAHATTVTLLGNSDSAWLARCANCDWKFVAGDRIKTVGRARFHEAETALIALLEATQSEPCPTCGGTATALGIPVLRGSPTGTPSHPPATIDPCPDCTNGRVPGAPLVLLAPRQVGCGMTVDERHAQFSDGLYQAGDYAFEEGENFTNAPWEPLYAAQTEEKQT